jgi:2-amino-4-hydroxy-6-hydroxymethyldihydropteridine diphosphokinase
MRESTVYLGLGGNEGDVLHCLKKALTALSHKAVLKNLRFSHFYKTSPVEVESQNWFINTVCAFETLLSLQEIFELTQAIEKELGKVPKPKNASRSIDIDLLFYNSKVYQNENLQIPHPKWKERLFVLKPLTDLTTTIEIQRENGMIERIELEPLLQNLLLHSMQIISLVEENPAIQ